MPTPARSDRRFAPAVSLWQDLRRVTRLASAVSLLVLSMAPPAAAQLYDSLDAHPPRWNLDGSDCNARVLSHRHAAEGGVDGRACEMITLVASHGTEALLVYPLEPLRPLDDLTAKVSVLSARRGARIGFRVRYPYVRDPETRGPASVVVYGTAYEHSGEFASIDIGRIGRSLGIKTMAMRRKHGVDADLSEPYVDAVVLNAYSGPGTTSLRIDELRIDGMVPLGDPPRDANASDAARAGRPASQRSRTAAAAERDSVSTDPSSGEAAEGISAAESSRRAFPVGRVTRILQHNGEPLDWVRSLGFDAVLLAGPPDADILREAIRSRVRLYAPPPSAPDPSLEPLLEPVAGWYIGSGVPLDSTRVEQAARTSRRLRSWPTRWQRPIVAAPVASPRRYMPWIDAMIDDLPVRARGLAGEEEVAEIAEAQQGAASTVEWGAGIASMPPETMLRQTDAIAAAIGAPRSGAFHWHAMWLQTIRALERAPTALLFRSTRSLASGSELAGQRAMALSYVNRTVAMMAPWLAGASRSGPVELSGADYRGARLANRGTDVLLLSSRASRGSEVLAGDGETLEVALPPGDASKTCWRLTHFSAERITPETDARGTQLTIVSPDAAEILVISEDPAVGSQLSRSAARFARQAGLDRWQLTSDAVRRTRDNWNTAAAARIVDREASGDMIRAAARTLRNAEPRYRAGDIEGSLRMACRADAWALRSQWRLAEALMPPWPHPTSCPPVDCGALGVQTTWFPLMSEEGWGRNRLTSGSLDSPELLRGGRWSFGHRLEDRAECTVSCVSRGAFSGQGALLARASPLGNEGLPGGYEGTVIQIRSPSVRVRAGTAIRIDAMVRTLGFGEPHQGLLVYDTIGGQQMGLLVRGKSQWTPVRLYRQALVDGELNVMFELIGAGEAIVDEVQLRVWEPQTGESIPLRPLEEASGPSPVAKRVDNQPPSAR